MRLSTQLYPEYRDVYSSPESFNDRLYQLRRGWVNRGVTTPPRLEEGQHWVKVGRSVLYTEEGEAEIRRIVRGSVTE